MILDREMREQTLKRAREYAETRWPDRPIEARLDPLGENVVFEYVVASTVGHISVDALMAKERML